ncbi:MAG: hypothetical protein IT378_11605 [Sandaracinaceae bacterium]|nr:hypothetical protein [Sandaracinaceae bacterium]
MRALGLLALALGAGCAGPPAHFCAGGGGEVAGPVIQDVVVEGGETWIEGDGVRPGAGYALVGTHDSIWARTEERRSYVVRDGHLRSRCRVTVTVPSPRVAVGPLGSPIPRARAAWPERFSIGEEEAADVGVDLDGDGEVDLERARACHHFEEAGCLPRRCLNECVGSRVPQTGERRPGSCSSSRPRPCCALGPGRALLQRRLSRGTRGLEPDPPRVVRFESTPQETILYVQVRGDGSLRVGDRVVPVEGELPSIVAVPRPGPRGGSQLELRVETGSVEVLALELCAP